MAVDALRERLRFPDFKSEKKIFSQISEGEINGEKIFICKPQAFMNLSGKSVGEIFRFYKMDPSDIFVFQDDLDLDFGQIRFRAKGTHGGHNGIKSIIENIGSSDFPRIKFGISSAMRDSVTPENFVLMNFSTDEWKQIPKLIEAGINKYLDFSGLKEVLENKN